MQTSIGTEPNENTHKIRSSRQLHICLLDDLARSAGRCETLAINLRRHAEQCREPNIKIGLERLATAEAEQANALRKLLLARGVWPRLATSPSRAGSNNWERLTADLALQLEIVRGLNLQIAKLEGDEPELAARLREFAFKEDKNLSGLRDFAAKCDPQALN